jgi:MFS family permease
MTLLFGFANGFASFANQATLYSQAPAEEIAVASGLYRTFSYVGAIFSSSLIGLTFGTAATDAGFHELGWVLAAIAVAVVLLTVFDRRIPLVANK